MTKKLLFAASLLFFSLCAAWLSSEARENGIPSTQHVVQDQELRGGKDCAALQKPDQASRWAAPKGNRMNVYDFTVKTRSGGEKSLSDYRGRVLLIVNTASKCGFTPQFEELQKLYETYRDRGLEILGFPCNQFAGQEPGSNDQVQEFCRLNYGVTFQIFAKGDVRGETAQDLFKYLTAEKGFKGFDETHPLARPLMEALRKNYPEYLEGDSIKWNFTKFLIDRTGKVVARFEPTTAPAAIAKEIEKLL